MKHVSNFKMSVKIWKISEDDSTKNIYVDMYIWMSEFFKNLKKYESDLYPSRIFYGTSKENMLILHNVENNTIRIEINNAFKAFLSSKYSEFVTEYEDIVGILQEGISFILELGEINNPPNEKQVGYHIWNQRTLNKNIETVKLVK